MMDTANAADNRQDDINTTAQAATRTVCFGRFVADIPADARVIASGAVWFWNRPVVEKKTHERYLFDYEKFKMERLSTAHEKFGNLFIREFDAGERDKAIYHWGRHASANSPKRWRAVSWRNGYEYMIEGVEVPEYPARYEAAIRKFFATIEHREGDTLPDRPGFCFEHGFIADDGTSYQNETATLGIRWRDVRITLDSMPRYKEKEESLLDRHAKDDAPESLKPFLHMIKVLRARRRVTVHLNGEEVLETLPTEEGGRQHLFHFEADSKHQDLYQPVITVKMETGVRDESSINIDAQMTDKEAMTFFDAIVESVRLRVPRPGTATASSGADTSMSVLQVRSGERAPHTGRYRHAREGALTPAILHIQQGQRLPPVELKDPRGLMDRLRDKPAVLAEDVVWEWLPDVPESGPSPN